MGTVEIIPNSPQLVSELLEHLKYLEDLNAPIQILIDLISKSQNNSFKNVHYFWFGLKALPNLSNIYEVILEAMNAI